MTLAGARVRLWIGPPKRGGWQHGTVIGIDTGSRPGVEIRFDEPVNGLPTCYATHEEVEVLASGPEVKPLPVKPPP